MPSKKTLSRKNDLLAQMETLRQARSLISAALGELHRRNSSTATTGSEFLTFEAILQDAIFEINSDPSGVVDPYLDPAVGHELSSAEVGKSYTLGSLEVPRKVGKLQALRSLKVALFGGRVTVLDENDNETTQFSEGILDSLKYVSVAEETG